MKASWPRSSFHTREVLLLCMLQETATLISPAQTNLLSCWKQYLNFCLTWVSSQLHINIINIYIKDATEILFHQITSFYLALAIYHFGDGAKWRERKGKEGSGFFFKCWTIPSWNGTKRHGSSTKEVSYFISTFSDSTMEFLLTYLSLSNFLAEYSQTEFLPKDQDRRRWS